MASESTIFRIQSLILLETLLTRGLSARISLFYGLRGDYLSLLLLQQKYLSHIDKTL